MNLFTPMKKSSDTETENNLPVISQRELKNFLEAEKNMFNYANVFIKILFLLNGGILAALFELKPNYLNSMIVLICGIEFSSLFYLISLIFLNISTRIITVYNYTKFKKTRNLSHTFLFMGICSSILSFAIFVIVFLSE